MFLAHFGHIFHILWRKFFFLEDQTLSHTTSYVFLAPCQNLEIINDTTPRKCPERWMDRRINKMMDRPYSLGPFQLPLGTQKGDR